MPLNRILIYARDIERTAEFYARHFGFEIVREPADRMIELVDAEGGALLLLHAAGKAQRQGQSSVKLVFDIEDVEAFAERSAAEGLLFGAIHHADGYVFANARDPDGNPVSISSRAFRTR